MSLTRSGRRVLTDVEFQVSYPSRNDWIAALGSIPTDIVRASFYDSASRRTYTMRRETGAAGVPDAPGWVPEGDITLAHFGAFGVDRGSDEEPADPVLDERAAIQSAFDYALSIGADCYGVLGRAYGVSNAVIWGQRSLSGGLVTDARRGTLRNCCFVPIGAGWETRRGDQSGDIVWPPTQDDPNDRPVLPWTWGRAVLIVGRSGAGTSGKRQISTENIEVDCKRRAAGGIHYVATSRALHSRIVVRGGLEYQVLVGSGDDNTSCTDSVFSDMEMREFKWTPASEAGVPGNGHRQPELRTSYGFVVRSADIKCTNIVSAICKECFALIYGFNNQYIGGSFWRSAPRTPGFVTGRIYPAHQRYRFLGTRFDDGRVVLIGTALHGQFVGARFIQYDHGHLQLVASYPNEVGERLQIVGSGFGKNAIVLSTTHTGSWGVFKGVCVGNTSDGRPLTIQGVGDRRVDEAPQNCQNIDDATLYSGVYRFTSTTPGTKPPGTTSTFSLLDVSWVSTSSILQRAWVPVAGGGFAAYSRRGSISGTGAVSWSGWQL
jgi:hypothetical protein